ncbi:MAG: hypothetical protein DRI95_01675 [Bacteroidetes bacterium]|nr:MAG: hypothetical protein DRI95_01675 [Bacteroidota bacterium]
MDLDTIIYIIATIVIFIVSLLGQKKKKKDIPVESETDEIVYSLNDFEKILQRKEEFSQTHELETEDKPVEEQAVAYKIDENNYVDKVEQRRKEIVDKKRKKKEEKEKNREKEEKEDGFDLNSAIIYSSILERKKFRH